MLNRFLAGIDGGDREPVIALGEGVCGPARRPVGSCGVRPPAHRGDARPGGDAVPAIAVTDDSLSQLVTPALFV